MMALACLFRNNNVNWRRIAQTEYTYYGKSLSDKINSIKINDNELESLTYWLRVFEAIFGLEKTVQNLWEESKKI
jgi:hypothetical protein